MNSFYEAFVQAYNHHEDVILSPDDVMMCVAFSFSKYVNDNAEELRKFFVTHEGKKYLQVTSKEELLESQWDEFFQLMIKEIANNTKGEIVSNLQCNFSTTTLIEQCLSTAVIMDSFKKYFSYGRMIPCCGIRNVHFMGNLDDWTKLKTKISSLKQYSGKDQRWPQYIEGVLEVIDQFIVTFKGTPNKEFWNKIMNFRHGSLGSGSTTYVTGWILKFFFGMSSEVDTGDIPKYQMDFPIEIINMLNGGQRKTVYLIGGFGGVNYANGAFRPQQSFIICEGAFEENQKGRGY